MKKALAIILLLSLLVLASCSVPADQVVESLGSYKSAEYYTSGGFQDFTDYAEYTFENVDFSSNEYFSKISSDSAENFKNHIEDFENWIECIKISNPENEVVSGYNFDSSIVSDNDYLYIYDDPDYPELGNYDVYFFDMETMTLYYFHNNI
ncbi:MAG: hypothetical protein ACI4XQ_07910 [Eubacteriales bacterium]